MTESAYRKSLNAAIEERKALMAQKDQLEIRVSRLNQSIYVLHRLCGDDLNALESDKEGLTTLIRNIVRSASKPMGSKDVRDELKKIGFPIPAKNTQAAVHAILKRLEKQQDIVPAGTGTPAMWIWRVKK